MWAAAGSPCVPPRRSSASPPASKGPPRGPGAPQPVAHPVRRAGPRASRRPGPESPASGVHDLAREAGDRELAQHALRTPAALAVAHLDLQRGPRRPLDERVVEERHAQLQRIPHRHLVRLHQQVLDQPAAAVDLLELVQRMCGAATPRTSSSSSSPVGRNPLGPRQSAALLVLVEDVGHVDAVGAQDAPTSRTRRGRRATPRALGGESCRHTQSGDGAARRSAASAPGRRRSARGCSRPAPRRRPRRRARP